MCTLILPSNYTAEAGRCVHRAFKAIHPNKSNKRVLLILSLETQKGPYPAEKWLGENTHVQCVLRNSGRNEASCWKQGRKGSFHTVARNLVNCPAGVQSEFGRDQLGYLTEIPDSKAKV